MNIRDVRQLGARFGNGPKGKGTLTVDSGAIRELADLIAETGLTEIEIEQNGQRVRVARQPGPVLAPRADAYVPVMSEKVATDSVAAQAAAPRKETVSGTPVASPMVGTVYVAPQPGAAPFVKLGDVVKEGDTLLIIEAMKTMNPIPSPKSGTVTEICIKDTEPVEFGQTLIILS